MIKPQISLIIPIYNAEKTLPKCLDSVAAQSLQSLQVILVDDGSTDSSAALANAYVERDNRFSLLRQENAGVSAARNLGISAAEGTYLMFADADDYLPSDAAELFWKAAAGSDVDLVISDFYRVYKDLMEIKGDIREAGLLDQRSFAREMMEKPADFYYGVMWNKLYRRELVTANGLKLDCRVKWCEDLLFNLQYLSHVQSVYVLKKPLYYYVNNANSLAKQNTTLKNWLSMKRGIYETYRSLFEELGMYERPADILKVSMFFMAVATDNAVRPKPNEVLRRIKPKKNAAQISGKRARKQRKVTARAQSKLAVLRAQKEERPL